MSAELEEQQVIKYFEDQNKVVSMHVRGMNLSDIQKVTGMTRAEVNRHLAEFKDYASQDKAIRSRAKGIVLELDTHYSGIISEAYTALEELKLNDDPRAVINGLKIIADIEAKRMELLAKAGLLADNSLGDQIAESEEKMALLVGILQKIARKYPEVAKEIAMELSEVTGDVEPIG